MQIECNAKRATRCGSDMGYERFKYCRHIRVCLGPQVRRKEISEHRADAVSGTVLDMFMIAAGRASAPLSGKHRLCSIFILGSQRWCVVHLKTNGPKAGR